MYKQCVLVKNNVVLTGVMYRFNILVVNIVEIGEMIPTSKSCYPSNYFFKLESLMSCLFPIGKFKL